MRALGAAVVLLLVACAASPRKLPVGKTTAAQQAWFPQKRCQQTQPSDRAACYKPWTVLIYMAADNDLLPYAYLNLYEMEASGDGRSASTERTDAVVQLDTPGPRGIRRLHMLPVGAPYDEKIPLSQFALHSEKDLRSPVIELLPEGNNPAAELKNFLDWGVRHYPAQHYMIVVWGHGEGWAKAHELTREVTPGPLLPEVPTAKDDPFGGRFRGGLAFDWSPPGFIDIPALREALQQVKQTLGRPVDVYAADACLMQMLEVTTELRETARFIVGSAYIQDFVGLPYRALFSHLNTENQNSPNDPPNDPARQIATLLPQLYQDSLDPAHNALRGQLSAELRKRFTMSSVATDELQRELLPALAELGAALDAYTAEDPLRTGDLQYIFQEQTGLYGSIQDLGAFLGALQAQLLQRAKQEPTPSPLRDQLQQAVQRARSAVATAVITHRFGTDYTADGQAALGLHALSVWLPISESDFRTRIADYRTSALYQYGHDSTHAQGPWQRWIERLYPAP